MATARKRWFRVYDSVLREDWTVRQRATLLGLLAWFNQRRQRDGANGDAAQVARIPPGDLLTITLELSLDDARAALRDLASVVTLKIREIGRFTEVRWPKLSELQAWDYPKPPPESPWDRPRKSREPPADFPPTAPSGSGSGTDSGTDSGTVCKRRAPSALGIVKDAWDDGIAAAAEYRPTASRWKLTESRSRALRALIAEHGSDAFARVVHGYRYARRSWAEIEDHFEPETLLRASNRQKYLEAFDEAVSCGLKPPFARESTNGQQTRDRQKLQALADFERDYGGARQ